MLNIISDADSVDEMRRVMSLNEDILRDLTTKVERFEDGPSIMMRKAKEKEERAGNAGNGAPWRGGRYASGRA